MNYYKILILILIIFSESENIFAKESIFNVNNISIIKSSSVSNEDLSNQAIKKGFNLLVEKILLNKDKKKLSDLSFSQIRELVSYYQVFTKNEEEEKDNLINYNISFDRNKLHDLFYQRDVKYSEITKEEVYLLPILKKDNQLYIYSQNYFYEKWNTNSESELVEFILPLENIEVIQSVNLNKNDLINLNLREVFSEYLNKNLALIILEETKEKTKIYLRSKILGKNVNKNISIDKNNLNKIEYSDKIIKETSSEIINLVKSQNLIDVKTPSFLNTKLTVSKNHNLDELNKRLKKIELIDSIYVQEFNNKHVVIKIRYLGKLDKIIKKLEKQKVILKLIDEQWSLKVI